MFNLVSKIRIDLHQFEVPNYLMVLERIWLCQIVMKCKVGTSWTNMFTCHDLVCTIAYISWFNHLKDECHDANMRCKSGKIIHIFRYHTGAITLCSSPLCSGPVPLCVRHLGQSRCRPCPRAWARAAPLPRPCLQLAHARTHACNARIVAQPRSRRRHFPCYLNSVLVSKKFS